MTTRHTILVVDDHPLFRRGVIQLLQLEPSFDVVVSNSTLDHFATRGEILVALAELHRVLRPGETRNVERKLQEGAHILGVLVGYRDLGKAQWRAVHVLPSAPRSAWYRSVIPASEVELQVTLDQQAISISKPD